MDEPKNSIQNNFSSLSPSTRIATGALALTLLSTFLPWARVIVFSFQGTDSNWGISIAVLSAIAIALFMLEIPQMENKALQKNIAIGLALFVAVIYSFCAIRLASVIDMDGEEIFSDAVSIGLGMYIGFISSIGAAVLLITDHWYSSRSSHKQIPFALTSIAIGMLALSVAQWGFLSIIGGLAAIAILFKFRPTIPQQTFSILIVLGLIAAGGGVARVATSDSSTNKNSSGIFGDTSKDPKCEELMSEGADVEEVEAADSCEDKDGDTVFLFTMSETCKSGKKLIYNDSGWGYKGEKWTKIGEAPSARCNSTATEQCTAMFSAGAVTQGIWTSIDECLVGEDVKWIYTSTMPCFMDDREYIYNEYGWGFVGEPWTLGSDTPSC